MAGRDGVDSVVRAARSAASRRRLAAEMRASTGWASTRASSACRAASSQGSSAWRRAGVASTLSMSRASGRMWKSVSNSALQTSWTR